MFRGLLALALAICVTGAPVVTGLCQATCATRASDAATQSAGAHHSCHTEAPAPGVSLIAVHACGHTDALPGFDRPEHVSLSFAIVPTLTPIAPPMHVAPVGGASTQVSPPPLIASTSQLRV
jgi:hypothetical protein